MSLILDALNRSRTEQDEVPTLVTRHDYADSRPSSGLLGLAVALLLAIALIAWLLWERAGVIEPVATRIPAAADIAAVEDNIPVAPSVPPAPAATTPAAEAVPMTAQASPGKKPTTTAPGDVPPAASLNASEDVSSLYRQRSAEPVPKPETVQPTAAATDSGPSYEETGVDIEKLVRKAEDELENARLAEHPAPFIVELSQQTKDAIPSIIYERHDYSGRPGQSVVVLNGKALNAGGSPASGVRVEEILPGSVVLDYRGTQFRLRALNSWVNL